MTDEKVAHLEHLSQLLIFQLRSVHKHIGKAWHELEVARSDLRELMDVHREWKEECEVKQRPWQELF